MNLIDNAPNQLSKFRIKNWFEINNGLRGTYNTISQIKYKTLMPKLNLFVYINAYILAKGAINGVGAEACNAAVATDRNNKQTMLKNCARFTHGIFQINNTQIFYSKDLDVAVPKLIFDNTKGDSINQCNITCTIKIL